MTRQGQPTISIVIPAFNEAGRIGSSLRRIDAFVRQRASFVEVIVVDDGSIDSTTEIVGRSETANLRLIRNQGNRGKGFSVREGVRAASGEYVLFVDTDLSAPIEEVGKLLDVALNQDAPIVIGSRNVDRRSI